jgi:CDP-diacylglycerol--serine O-phosphatidyltransferase
MNRVRTTRSLIPNLFTALNLFSGFLSIINASQGQYHYAAWLIIIAAIFDALDGAVARLTGSSSELGVELDSLSDIVSFGAAPALLIYQVYLYNFNTLGVILSSFIIIAGGFRLARFNVQLVGFNKDFFTGLPIPINAITISSFVLTYYNPDKGFIKPYDDFIIPLIVILSYLMVSKIKYDTIPKPSKEEIKAKPLQFVFIILALILIIITSGKALFFIFVFIILFGIFRHLFGFIIKQNK